jgi:hypothetical protein
MLQKILGISCLHMEPKTAVSSSFTVFMEDRIAFPALKSLQPYKIYDYKVHWSVFHSTSTQDELIYAIDLPDMVFNMFTTHALMNLSVP